MTQSAKTKSFTKPLPLEENALTGDLRELGDIAIALEKEHHRRGWDSLNPVLCCVSDVTGVIQLGDMPLHPRDMLSVFAHIYEDAAEKMRTSGEVTRAMRETTFLQFYFGKVKAHALAMEAWGVELDGKHPEDFPGNIADMQGAYEKRLVILVAGPHQITIERKRGEEPEIFYRNGDEDAEAHYQGPMFESLVRIDRAARHIVNPERP